MFRTRTIVLTIVATLGIAVALHAQTTPRAPQPSERSQLRHQVYVMEGALARAVEFGAQSLNREIRTVMPDIMVMAGQARARGVYLENYGIFFDVEVPVMRQSLTWSLRMMLDKDEAGVRSAIADIRRLAQTDTDPRRRASLEGAANRLELQFVPPGSPPANPPVGTLNMTVPDSGAGDPAKRAAASVNPAQDGAPPPPIPMDKLWVKDPNRAYTESIQQAIIDAMIDYSAPMRIRPEEWLTVAARDNQQQDSFAPQDPFEEVVTVLLQISGADLAAYRKGEIDRNEARKRVIIREF